jgi:tRNA pseudouridine synthase
MALLFMVGQGLEPPEVITKLLDVVEMPAKPHYQMANELPLVLHECGFDNMRIQLQPQVLWALTDHYESLWEKYTIAAARARNALETVLGWSVRAVDVDAMVAYLLEKKKNITGRKSGWKNKDRSDAGSSSGGGDDSAAVEGRVMSSSGHWGSGLSEVEWRVVLQRLKEQYQLSPRDALLPHVPLVEVS